MKKIIEYLESYIVMQSLLNVSKLQLKIDNHKLTIMKVGVNTFIDILLSKDEVIAFFNCDRLKDGIINRIIRNTPYRKDIDESLSNRSITSIQFKNEDEFILFFDKYLFDKF